MCVGNLKTKVFSYCYEDLVSTQVPKYQKEVFEKFNITLNQYAGSLKHSEFMDYIMNQEDSDIYIFFDIDCIPIKQGICEYIAKTLNEEECIIGIEQCDNGRYAEELYAGPACFGIKRELYDKMNKLSFSPTYRGDCAQEWSWVCKEKNIKVIYFKFTSCAVPKWRLGYKNMLFGQGSIYEDWLYHEFEIRFKNNTDSFINKCKEVLEYEV